MKQLRIRQVSESEFSVKGHGVHTAFVETVRGLKKTKDAIVLINRAKGQVDITHIHTIGFYSLWYLLTGSSKKVVSAHVIPASLVGSLVAAKFWLPIATSYIRWFYNHADVVIAVSDATKRELIAIGVTKPIEVAYNMVDTKLYHATSTDKQIARQELGLDSKAWIVIGAGQVQPRKRVDSMVKLASKLPDMTFVWVGGLPFKKAAADSASMQRLMRDVTSNMLFPGIVPLDEIKQWYHAADVFFLPSQQETFGLVVVEAAASGLPIVLRDIPDYKETFSDLAILASEKDFEATFKKLKNEPSYYNKSQRDALKLAARYDSKAASKQLLKLYRSLL